MAYIYRLTTIKRRKTMPSKRMTGLTKWALPDAMIQTQYHSKPITYLNWLRLEIRRILSRQPNRKFVIENKLMHHKGNYLNHVALFCDDISGK
jgi:hypothetical protein